MPVSLDGNNSGGSGTTIVLGGNGNSGGSDWLDWIRTGLAVKSALQKPSFSQAPMSPEMKQIYQMYINSLMDPAYKNLGHDVVARAQQQADRLGQGSWTSPKTFSGDVGYRGTGAGAFGVPSGLSPWTDSAKNTTFPGQHLPIMSSSAAGSAEGGPAVQKFVRNMQQWEPASGFPMAPTSPEVDPNREVSLDRVNHPLANINPTGANGSLFQTGADQGTPRQNADGSYTKGGTPAGMSYSPGEMPNFANYLRSQGVKDAAKIAIGWFSGGLTGAALAAAKVWWDHYQNSKPKGGG